MLRGADYERIMLRGRRSWKKYIESDGILGGMCREGEDYGRMKLEREWI
jgi:hypothetical protein